MKRRIHRLLAVITFASAIAAPRTLANGAPAPGNTMAKSYTDSPITRSAAALRTARSELAVALAAEHDAAVSLQAHPRVLANGAPACGNTGGKLSCTTERADKEWKERIQRLVQAGVAVRARTTRVAALTKRALADQKHRDTTTADLLGMNR